MMGLSIWHILLLLAVIVLVFGTSKIRSLGKDLGGAIRDFKNSVREENKKDQLTENNIIEIKENSINTTSEKI